MCVQLHKDWDLAADMHKPGWGVIYPLIVHNKHPDLQEYNKAVGLDDMVSGKEKEDADETEARRKAKVLKRVRHKEQQDDEAGSTEMNPRTCQLSAELDRGKEALPRLRTARR